MRRHTAGTYPSQLQHGQRDNVHVVLCITSCITISRRCLEGWGLLVMSHAPSFLHSQGQRVNTHCIFKKWKMRVAKIFRGAWMGERECGNWQKRQAVSQSVLFSGPGAVLHHCLSKPCLARSLIPHEVFQSGKFHYDLFFLNVNIWQ